jgi:NitT/TauT family transport system substrate-binding protein
MRLAPARARTWHGTRLHRRFRPAAMAAFAGVLLAGCGALGNNSNGSTVSGGTTITVAAIPGIGNAPLYIAAKDGLFSQHGLTVTIRKYTSLAQEIDDLNSGQVDIAAGDYTGFFNLFSLPGSQNQQKADNLRVVADGYDAVPGVMEVLTRSGSKITSPAQLEGQTVATPQAQAITLPKVGSPTQPYNIETLATESVLRNDGASTSSITWDPMPAGQEVSALRNHTVGAILVTEPYIFQAESQLGAVALLDSCSGVTSGIPLLGYFTTAAYAAAHPATAQAFQAALLQAQGNAAVRGPVQSALTSTDRISSSDTPLITLGTYPSFFSIGQVQRVADLMYDAGMLTNRLSLRDLSLRS